MEQIHEVNIVDQHNIDMLLYAIYVARDRVVPDYRDGLKPVHRRIIYDMYHDLHAYGSNKVKTSRVSGDVIGRYHPHGDAAVSAAMKPMVNSFEIKEPYLKGQGGWGDPCGNPMAHPRYTEVSLSDYSMDCIVGDLKETHNAVDWSKNYSDNMDEPQYLPAIVPNLLINGAYGIAVGLSVDIPRHNFAEVIDATIGLIKNPNMDVVLVPDNCLPTDIICSEGFEKICKTGMGNYKVRARVECTTYNGPAKHYRGRPALRITSVPDITFFDTVQNDINKLVEGKKFPQFDDIINDSTGESWDYKMCIWIILKKGSNAHYVRQLLYSTTSLQKGRGVRFEILRNNQPENASYKEYLQAFIDFRRMTKFRMYCNRLKMERTRSHKMDAYIKALQSGKIDTIYKMIRSMKGINDTENIEILIKKLTKILPITDVQAKYIMEMNFKKVSAGYLAKYKKIYDEAIQNAERYMEIIGDEQHIDVEIIRELEWAKAKYGKPRMSRLITKEEANCVPAGTFKVVITSDNRIRKLEVNAKITDLRGESPKCILVVDNRDSILLFSTLGKVFKIPVSVLSFEFQDIRLVVKKLTSDIASIVMDSSMKTFSKNKHHFIYTLSRNGYIKRMDCADFLSIPVSGIIYAKLDPGDEIVDVMFMSDKYDLMVFSENRALRFAGTEAPYLRRSTKGNYSMSTNHPMKGMVCVRPNATALVIITAGGRINKIPLVSIKNGKRTQAGSSVIKLGKGDNIISTLICGENETIHVVFETGKEVDIPVNGIEPGSSISPGKKLGARVAKAFMHMQQ